VTVPVAPGVVLAVWSSTSVFGRIIRLGAVLRDRPGVANHVIGITHQDEHGRWIGMEGRPGGVGLVDATPFLADPRTRGNYDQPRPDGQGQLTVFLAAVAKSAGTRYDWVGIADDAGDAVGVDLGPVIDRFYRWPAAHDRLPGQVVCSSLFAAAYALDGVGWAHPATGAERKCEPADWWDWSDRQRWREAAR